MLPQEQSAAQQRVPLNTYWDHTTACIFEKYFIHLFWQMMHIRQGIWFMYHELRYSCSTFYRTWHCDLNGLWYRKGREYVKISLIVTFNLAVEDIFVVFFREYTNEKNTVPEQFLLPWGFSTCLRSLSLGSSGRCSHYKMWHRSAVTHTDTTDNLLTSLQTYVTICPVQLQTTVLSLFLNT